MSQHWYSIKDGAPVYEVPKSKGEGTRPTNLRDARKLKLVPSVTTLFNQISKPMLERWKQDQLLNAVLEYPFDMCKHNIDTWKKHVITLSQREGKEAAERGSIIHDALEQFYKVGKIKDKTLHKFCIPVVELLDSEFGAMTDWVAEKSFAHELGFGGKCDLHVTGDTPIVLDFKTKSLEDISAIKPYIENCMQLAAYRMGFGIENAECYNLFISTSKPGQLKLYKWTEAEIQKGWKMFLSLLEFWKLENNFNIS